MYKIMTKGQGKLRRDLVYEVETKGGMGITNVQEEYKINRLRGLRQDKQEEGKHPGYKEAP